MLGRLLNSGGVGSQPNQFLASRLHFLLAEWTIQRNCPQTISKPWIEGINEVEAGSDCAQDLLCCAEEDIKQGALYARIVWPLSPGKSCCCLRMPEDAYQALRHSKRTSVNIFNLEVNK